MNNGNEPKQFTSKVKYGSFIADIHQSNINKGNVINEVVPSNLYTLKSGDSKIGVDIKLTPQTLVKTKSEFGGISLKRGLVSQYKEESKLLQQQVLSKDRFYDRNHLDLITRNKLTSKMTEKNSSQVPTQQKINSQILIQPIDFKTKSYMDFKSQKPFEKQVSKIKEVPNAKVAAIISDFKLKNQIKHMSKIQQQEKVYLEKQHLNVKMPNKSNLTSNLTEKQDINNKFEMCCIMKENHDVFYLSFQPIKMSVLEAVIDKLNQIYQTKLTSYQYIEFRLVKIKVEQQYKNWAQIQYQFGDRIANIEQYLQQQKQKLVYVGVVIKDNKFMYRHVNQIYKSPEKPVQKLISIEGYDREGIILKFDAIRPYPVKYILDILDYKKSQGRCLKMHQKFYLKDQFLPFGLQRANVNHLTAKVIGEQYQFDKIMRQTSQLREQQLQRLVNKKVTKKITPLIIYTGNFTYQQNQKEELTFESVINRYLKNYFRNVNRNQDDWRNKLVKSMLRQMQKLSVYQGWTYWICPIDFSNYQADKEKRSITFPQFLRTNLDEPLMEDLKEGSTLFKIKSKTGKKMNLPLNSRFQNTQRVIFRPFTNFKINKSAPSLFELQQTKIEQHTILVNFILWVDGNSKESQQMFKRLNCPISTYKYYFDSTQSLQKWLNKQADQIVRPHIKIIIVTNMRRIQNKVDIKDAGVKTVVMVRQKIPTAPIIVYINNKQVSQSWLRSAKIDLSTIELIDSAKQFLDTLTNYCCRTPIKKKTPSPPTIQVANVPSKLKKQNWRNLFDFTLPQ